MMRQARVALSHLLPIRNVHCDDSPSRLDEKTTLSNWSGTSHLRLPTSSILSPTTLLSLRSMLEDCSKTSRALKATGIEKKGMTCRVVGNMLSPNGVGFIDSHSSASQSESAESPASSPRVAPFGGSNTCDEDANTALNPFDKVITLREMTFPQPEGEGLSIPLDNGSLLLTINPNNPRETLCTAPPNISVSDLLDAVKPFGLTMKNLASIDQQSLGGFVGVGAHGSGGGVGTGDTFVEECEVLNPSSAKSDKTATKLNPSSPDFDKSVLNMGSLSILTSLTLALRPRYKIHEKTYTLTRSEAVSLLNDDIVGKNDHVRFMWIPGEDKVIVVVGNEVTVDTECSSTSGDETEAKKDLLKLARELNPNTEVDESLSFADLRQLALTSPLAHPLSPAHIKSVNTAEGNYWQGITNGSRGTSRVGWNEEVLQFDCGGSQEVLEVCFPVVVEDGETRTDVDFLIKLLDEIDRRSIPAPGPIEQRWTRGSRQLFSPASVVHGQDGEKVPFGKKGRELFCWVGVIMYLPLEEEVEVEEGLNENGSNTSVGGDRGKYQPRGNRLRNEISRYFADIYTPMVYDILPKFGAPHWSKILLPRDEAERQRLKHKLRERYPVHEFQKHREKSDPDKILGNWLADWLFRDCSKDK